MRFGYANFPIGSNDLVIRRRFHTVPRPLTYDLKYVVYRMSRDQLCYKCDRN